jgi:glucose-6-phosphate isomerase
MTSLSRRKTWSDLRAHGDAVKAAHVSDMFANELTRGLKCMAKAGPLTLDYSRERIDAKGMDLLVQLAIEADIAAARKKLFEGGLVNTSEKRPALHTALRASSGKLMVNGEDIMLPIGQELGRALRFAEKLRAGRVKGIKNDTIRNIIHVGIGGSDLGPRLLVDALSDTKGPFIHFIANADPQPIEWLMDALDPKETMVLLTSKSFTTAEVQRNGKTLIAWLEKSLGGKARNHLLAATAAPEAAKAFGVPEDNIFHLWDWIGGRFSVCSSVSLSAIAAMGEKAFLEFLRGAEEMDKHFQEAPLSQNLPVLLALIELWNVNILGLNARAVLPYSEALDLWPSYLQQLEMESLGKSVDQNGQTVDYSTCPIIIGGSGTPAQHAFMQALHQGTQITATEILVIKNGEGAKAHHNLLLANALAQAEALAFGKPKNNESDPVLAAQKRFDGNRPSSILALDELSPRALGALIALYEHKVFVLGHLWNLNPFDQWGVELGKQLAGPFEAYLAGGEEPERLPALLKEIR